MYAKTTNPTESKEAHALEAVDSSTEAMSDVWVDPTLEKAVTAKFDRYVMPQFAILMLIAYLDRSNVGNARVFGFEESLNLTGNQFGDIVTLFYVTYVLFEVPWTMSVKKYGANNVLALAFVGWAITTLGSGFVHTYAQAIACRLLLGIFEAGLAPCLAFLISTMYARESQAKRMAVIYISVALSGAFGGLIAYGIQTMGEKAGLEAWRWLFIIEGIITFVICGICWFTLPKSAEVAWFLTEAEQTMMQARKQRDISYKGEDKFDWKYAKMALFDPAIWVAAVSLFAAGVSLFGFGTFLPTILKGLGYTSLQANYLSIPVYIWACICVATTTWLSDKFTKRALIAGLVPIPVIIGYAIAVGTSNHAAGYFAMFLCAALYCYNTLILTWVSNNIKPDYKRSVGLPVFVGFANISGAVAGQIYPARTGPRYIMGNSVCLGMEVLAMVGIAVLYSLFKSRDAKKQQLLDSGVTDNGKEGDRGLDFKYIL